MRFEKNFGKSTIFFKGLGVQTYKKSLPDFKPYEHIFVLILKSAIMMRKSSYGTGIMLMAAGMLLFTACRRNAPDLKSNISSLSDDDKGYGSDQASLEKENNDVISIADVAANTG